MIAGFSAAAMLAVGAGCGSGNNAATSGTAEVTSEPSGTDDSLEKVLSAKQLILGLDASFPPMGFTDESNNIVGFDIDMAEEVCKRIGVTLVKQPIDWNNKVEELNLNRIDCIWNGMSINASRAEAMNLSEPYMRNEMVFVVPGNSSIKSMDDLNGKTIGVQTGSSAQEILEASELYKNISVTPLEDNVTLLSQMELGFSDAVFLDSVVAYYIISKNNKDYVVLPGNLEQEEYAIGFRKSDQALRDKVQETLSAMKADGTLAKISEKWFGSDVTTVE